MGDLLIRNVPEDLKRELSEAAHRAGRSLSDEAKMRLEGSNIGNVEPAKSGKAFLEEIQALFADIPDDERDEFAKIMDEIEQERKKDFGRPFSFDE
jgi:plasmid stability protein